MVGKTLGRYEILGELGSGGMATVYRARDGELGRQVALKVMHPHLAKQKEFAERFRREARAVAALRHRHVIEIHDFVQADYEGTPLSFIVSELIEGPSLADFLKEHRLMLPEVAALVGSHLCEALHCAHQAGIVHRDVKPENVLVAAGGRVVLTDFGVARVLTGQTMTATGALIGSPNYMSPEQARGRRPLPASDLFSVGVLLYRLVTGRLPFPGRDPITVISSILKGNFTPPERVEPSVGGAMDGLIRRCLRVDPDRRPASGAGFSEDLLEFAAEGGLTDADGELSRYFEAPADFTKAATVRIVDSLVVRADRRLAEGALALTLGLCNRALLLDPKNAEAERILQESTRRRASQRWLTVGFGVCLIAGLLGGLGWWLWSRGPGGSAGAPKGKPVDAAVVAPPQRDAEALRRPLRLVDASTRARAGMDAAVSRPMDARRPPGRRGGMRPRVGGMTRPGTMLPDRPRPLPDAGSLRPRPRPRPDAAVPKPAGPGMLLIRIMPWCNLTVDGRSFGRSPMPKARSIAAGWHVVSCKNPVTGKGYRKRVRVRSGQLSRLQDRLP